MIPTFLRLFGLNLEVRVSILMWPSFFSSQAALFIESHQKFAEIRVKLDEVQNKLQITKKSAESAERSLPLLRQKDLEQTVTIEHLSQRVQRISAGMDIAENGNDKTTAPTIFVHHHSRSGKCYSRPLIRHQGSWQQAIRLQFQP